MDTQTPKTGQEQLDDLYIEAWFERYQSKAHWERCAVLMGFAHDGEFKGANTAKALADALDYEAQFHQLKITKYGEAA